MKHYHVSSITNLSGATTVLSLMPDLKTDKFDYQPGQYLSLGFSRNGRKTPMRSFSIVSSPTRLAQGEELQVALQVKGNFTNAASNLKLGDRVQLQGPFGSFTINPSYDTRIVMLAGGIGVTPFISMLRWAADRQFSVPITLLYSCRTVEDMSFRQEILALQQHNPNFEVGLFVTGKQLSASPDIVQGSIMSSHIAQLTHGQYAGSTYFVCGPNGFMSAQRAALIQAGVDDSRIITESFTQSSKLFSLQGWDSSKLSYAFAGLLLIVGVAGIMALDLLRVVSRTSRTVSAQSSAATAPATTTTTTQAAQPTTQTTATPAAAENSSTTVTTTTQPTNYRQPMSSVS
jgi:ferredoxin-NADP reductase